MGMEEERVRPRMMGSEKGMATSKRIVVTQILWQVKMFVKTIYDFCFLLVVVPATAVP